MGEQGLKFHFSGICGAGMGNVATLLARAGHEVQGSDEKAFPPMSVQLHQEGIPVHEGYGDGALDWGFQPDLQVVSNVMSRDNAEVEAGRRRGLRQVSFPEVLEEFILPGRTSCVVAGTHGKTTTSSLLHRLLRSTGAGCFVGGVMKDGSSGCDLGVEGAPFVLEGDEYDTAFFDKNSKFLHYGPTHLCLTHLEWDHVDIFPTFEDMLKQFRALIAKMPAHGQIVYNGDEEELRNLVKAAPCRSLSYGEGEDCDLRLMNREATGPLAIAGPDGPVELPTSLVGRIYQLNLLGAYATARYGLGIDHGTLVENLGDFSGAQRRFECLGADEERVVISDFAHHPTAVAATLAIARETFPGRPLVAVFDPRNATSRRRVFEERLMDALKAADEVFLAPPPVDRRLNSENRLDVMRLAEGIGSRARGFQDGAVFVDSVAQRCSEGRVVLVMSCGSCYGLLDRLKGLLEA